MGIRERDHVYAVALPEEPGRDRDVGRCGALAGPLIELGIERRQFVDVVPDRFQRMRDDFVGQSFVPDHINVISKHTGVADNASG